MNGAKIARTRITPSRTRPNTASGFAVKSAAIRRNGVSTARGAGTADGTLATTLPLALRQPDARIEHGIQDVDGEVDRDEERDDHEQVGDDHRPVEHDDRIDQELAHPGPGEHALRDDREG